MAEDSVVTRCSPPVDDLRARPAGPWTIDKLEILSSYLPAFAKACKDRAPAWFYVDGFAGPGVNVVQGLRLCGSPLIALQTEPIFAKCLLLDDSPQAVEALKARALAYGDRAEVRRGDANQALLPLMRDYVHPRAPCLCVLDPEGFEVEWATIEQLAAFGKERLTELLILFQADGLHRVLGLVHDRDWPGAMATRFFGNERWRPIAERKERGKLTVDQARNEFLGLYCDGLRGLGYETLTRDIYEQSTSGRLKYVLVFASGNAAGISVMDHCFKNTYMGVQRRLFYPERPV